MDLANLRKEYTRSGITKDSLDPDPFKQFEIWFNQACEANLVEPNAMSLSTVSPDGQPSIRTVLLKEYDPQGFVFYTNYGSAKAREIASNPKVALLFPWLALERQVIIKGSAAKVSTARSLRYFLSRPRGSQLGAWVSQQSGALTSRKVLETALGQIKAKFEGGQVPLPSFWGGYLVRPASIEFWQGRENRLHDRLCYDQGSGGAWEIIRKSP